MSKDLYFIPIIADALKAPNVDEALERAFDKIRSLGRKPQYRQGLLQFEQFMHRVNQYDEKKSGSRQETVIRTLMVELATDTFEGTDQERQAIMEAISSRSDWEDEYRRLVEDIEQLHRTPTVTKLFLLRDSKPFGSVEVSKNSLGGVIDGVTPGAYCLKLDTGRAIWQEVLAERDLLWTKAFPGQPLRAAADAGGAQAPATRRLSVLGGEITLLVFAGLECGSIEIRLNPSVSSR